jgi:hypothetical protein
MMKTFNYIGVLLALFMTSCATAPKHSSTPTPTPSDAEKTAAMNDYVKCIEDGARRLDNGESDASLMALALQPDCDEEFSRYVEISGSGMGSDALDTYRETLEVNQPQITTGIILRIRSGQLAQN